jgi:hypothetical protein
MNIGKIYHFRSRGGGELYLRQRPASNVVRQYWAFTGLMITYWKKR